MRLIKVKNILTSQTFSRKLVAQQVASLFLTSTCNGEKGPATDSFVYWFIDYFLRNICISRAIAIFRFRPIDRGYWILIIIIPSFRFNRPIITPLHRSSMRNAFNEWLLHDFVNGTPDIRDSDFPVTRTSLSSSRISLFLFFFSICHGLLLHLKESYIAPEGFEKSDGTRCLSCFLSRLVFSLFLSLFSSSWLIPKLVTFPLHCI